MKTISDHISNARQKPHHVRRQIAFAAAAGMTAFVGVVWLAGSVATGLFAIKGSNFAESTGAEGAGVTTSAPGKATGLAGAGAALDQGADASVGLEVVNAKSSTTTPKANPTVIPF